MERALRIMCWGSTAPSALVVSTTLDGDSPPGHDDGGEMTSEATEGRPVNWARCQEARAPLAARSAVGPAVGCVSRGGTAGAAALGGVDVALLEEEVVVEEDGEDDDGGGGGDAVVPCCFTSLQPGAATAPTVG